VTSHRSWPPKTQLILIPCSEEEEEEEREAEEEMTVEMAAMRVEYRRALRVGKVAWGTHRGC
jgi:hypothetical protein